MRGAPDGSGMCVGAGAVAVGAAAPAVGGTTGNFFLFFQYFFLQANSRRTAAAKPGRAQGGRAENGQEAAVETEAGAQPGEAELRQYRRQGKLLGQKSAGERGGRAAKAGRGRGAISDAEEPGSA